MKRSIILIAVAMMVFLALNSFAAGPYEIGMSKQDVIELLGQPVLRDIHGAYERWEYELQGDITEVFHFKYGRLIQMVRWATDPRGRKLRVIDILSIAYKKCSVWEHRAPQPTCYPLFQLAILDS